MKSIINLIQNKNHINLYLLSICLLAFSLINMELIAQENTITEAEYNASLPEDVYPNRGIDYQLSTEITWKNIEKLSMMA